MEVLRKYFVCRWTDRVAGGPDGVLGLRLIAMVIALVYAPLSADAHDRDVKVRFKPGTISSTIKDRIKGYDVVRYRVGANSEQVMSILFSPNVPACYFNVTPPGADEAIFNGSGAGNEFSASLEASGDYIVTAYLMRNEARRGKTCTYSITFEISG
jgi:hypothetical protein